ncbi:hypothetical protein PISMIDRAFT_680977, partial [Pisolithus microcarpus 441]
MASDHSTRHSLDDVGDRVWDVHGRVIEAEAKSTHDSGLLSKSLWDLLTRRWMKRRRMRRVS